MAISGAAQDDSRRLMVVRRGHRWPQRQDEAHCKHRFESFRHEAIVVPVLESSFPGNALNCGSSEDRVTLVVAGSDQGFVERKEFR
jgi:hypothetical protein